MESIRLATSSKIHERQKIKKIGRPALVPKAWKIGRNSSRINKDELPKNVGHLRDKY
jgi:hypothetical protein